MKQTRLLKPIYAVLIAATATLAPLGAAQAADIYEFAFRQPEPAGAQGPVRADASAAYEARNHELGFLQDVLWPQAARGAQGPVRSDADDRAERDLQRRLGGFGGPGTH